MKRFKQHLKDKKKSAIHKHGKLQDWKVKTIGKFKVKSNKDLEYLETEYIKMYYTMDYKLVNVQKKLPEKKTVLKSGSVNLDNKMKIGEDKRKGKVYGLHFFIPAKYSENGKRKKIRVSYKKCGGDIVKAEEKIRGYRMLEIEKIYGMNVFITDKEMKADEVRKQQEIENDENVEEEIY